MISMLPRELLLLVADNLQPEDVINLAQTSKQLAYIIEFTVLCKRVLMAHALYSPEAIRAQEDGDHATGLRTLVKRRDAIRKAKPFHVALVAVGSWFVYTNGVLCYNTKRGHLRLLDIKNSADHEIVVNVFKMLSENEFQLPEYTGHILMPIHYGHGVLTCELRLEERPYSAYLIVLRPLSGELLLIEEQPLDEKTVVATSEKYLFLCHPVNEPHPVNERHPAFWGLRKFDLETLQWVHEVPRFVSTAKLSGNSVACTIYGNHVYVVSSCDPLIHINRVLPGGGGRSGMYHQATRLPLEASHNHPLEVEATKTSWIQPYSGEMCMEDWAFLSLETDEKTGNLRAAQIRMEYPDEGPNTRRKCIKRTLAFPGDPADPPPTTNLLDVILPPGNGPNIGERHAFSVNAGIAGDYNGFGSPPDLPPKTTCHFGENSSTTLAYSASQCFVRSYFSTSNSFVDLVNGTRRRNRQEQSLRLRVMTEIPGGGNKTVFWPPEHDPLNPDAQLQELHRIMNPPGYDGDVEWNVDGSSFVYAMTSHNNSLKRAIVYVGFDPTVKVHRLKSFNKANPKGPGENVDTGSHDKEQKPSFPSLGVSWAWLEEPLYFREGNGFDFFA